MEIHVDVARARITFPRNGPEMPPICTACGAASADWQSIRGASKSLLNIAAMLTVGIGQELHVAVALCRRCRWRDRGRIAAGFVVGAACLVAGGALLGWLPQPWDMLGLGVMIAGPAAVAVVVIRKNRLPVVHRWDRDTFTVRYRYRPYVAAFQAWQTGGAPAAASAPDADGASNADGEVLAWPRQ